MRRFSPLALAAVLALSATSCSKTGTETAVEPAAEGEAGSVAATTGTETNPFFAESELYLRYPAFEQGMAEQLAEIEAIASQQEPANFDNTLVALERSGRTLNRVSRVFFSMASAHTNDDIETVRSEMAPKLSAHTDKILLNPDLFARIQALYEQRDAMELDPESYRLIEEYYKDFVRSGALLSDADKETLKELNAELASLQTKFSQNVLDEVNELAIVVDTAEELAGLSEDEIAAAAEAAKERDLEGKYVLPLLNTTGQPALASLEDRSLRERIMETSLSRGSHGGEYDNRGVLSRIARLRAERAQLLGY
jgi:peptidyl-dipeptidase Dcp